MIVVLPVSAGSPLFLSLALIALLMPRQGRKPKGLRSGHTQDIQYGLQLNNNPILFSLFNYKLS